MIERVTARWFDLDGITIHECTECYALVRHDRLGEHLKKAHAITLVKAPRRL